ncbi:MAG: hypothetical protein Q9169_005195 [Polycauliona sp. 2 TL-2023]
MMLGNLVIWCFATTSSYVSALGSLSAPGLADVSPAKLESRALSVDVVYQAPNNTWLENLAVCSNGNSASSHSPHRYLQLLTLSVLAGQILVTVLTTPDLYQVNPSNGQANLIHSFTDHLGLVGIAELGQDIFYVIAGNVSVKTGSTVAGAWDIYRVDMGPTPPRITLTSHFPNAVLLHGMDVLDAKAGLLAVGDAAAGVLYRLNVNTGVNTIVIDDPSFKPPPGQLIGIDGLKIRDNTLYFSNFGFATINEIPIRADGTAAGSVVVVARDEQSDDICFDIAGRVYLTVTEEDRVDRVFPIVGAPGAEVVAGPSSKLDGPTACGFGRKLGDFNALYVTTNGGLEVGDQPSRVGGTLRRVNNVLALG